MDTQPSRVSLLQLLLCMSQSLYLTVHKGPVSLLSTNASGAWWTFLLESEEMVLSVSFCNVEFLLQTGGSDLSSVKLTHIASSGSPQTRHQRQMSLDLWSGILVKSHLSGQECKKHSLSSMSALKITPCPLRLSSSTEIPAPHPGLITANHRAQE